MSVYYYDQETTKVPGDYRIIMYKNQITSTTFMTLTSYYDYTRFTEPIFNGMGYGILFNKTLTTNLYSPRSIRYHLENFNVQFSDPRDYPIPEKWDGTIQSYCWKFADVSLTYYFRYNSSTGYCQYSTNQTTWYNLTLAHGLWFVLIGGGGGGCNTTSTTGIWWNTKNWGGGGGGGGATITAYIDLNQVSSVKCTVGKGGDYTESGGDTVLTYSIGNSWDELRAGGGGGASGRFSGSGGGASMNYVPNKIVAVYGGRGCSGGGASSSPGYGNNAGSTSWGPYSSNQGTDCIELSAYGTLVSGPCYGATAGGGAGGWAYAGGTRGTGSGGRGCANGTSNSAQKGWGGAVAVLRTYNTGA